MMVSCRSFLWQVVALTIFLVSGPLSSASTPHSPPFRRIYAFGDSYTDTGNTQSATGPTGFNYVSSPPYGSTFFHHPTNRYSDGRLVIDFVAEALSLPYLPPYRNHTADVSKGVNFAVAGSTAIPHDFFVRNNLTFDITPESLQTQLQWFNKALESQGCRGNLTKSKCREILDDSLIWVGEIGANDYAYTVGSSVSAKTIQNLAIESFTGFLQAMLEKGAKYIVVQGLPQTGCLPLAMVLAPDTDRDRTGCVGSVSRQSYAHNLAIQAKIQGFGIKFPHAVIVYADYWNAYHTIMINASKYGFKERFKTCCGSGEGAYNFNLFAACGSATSTTCQNPAQYVNWDGVHLTEGMYKVVSDMFLRGKFCHPPFDYLLSRKLRSG
ncbi:GDSL lipase/esterase [Dillenia turbinata]|uniref:GDSL lipase/esterase n=1 Tax=Dillenia turbinata TaxID=194707 RepID=A0AAN8V0T6_9MAGN